MTDKTLEQMMRLGRMDRRDFLKAAMAVGAGAAVINSPLGWAQSDAPVKGGKLRVGFMQGSTGDSLDPATFNNDFQFAVGYAVWNNLNEIGPDGKLTPELAESWEATPDAKTWTFKLRTDVTFSNGKPLTSEDVLASVAHHRGEDSKSAIKPLLAQVTSMRADGPHAVVFELEGGNADFPYIFPDYHMGIRPAVDGKIDPLTDIGTGGYTIAALEPGQRAVLKRRNDYWKSDRAHLDEVEIIVINDVAARMNALMTGEVDLIDRPDLKTVNLLQRRPGLRIKTATGTLHYVFPMHTDAAPFDNNDLRLALKYAVDREDMVQKVLMGFGTVGNDQPISPSMPYYAELPQRAYDPDKARFHIKKAGMENTRIDLSVSDAAFGGAVDAGVLMAEHARKAGININVVREPADGYWSNVWLVKPFCASYWGGRATPDLMFSTGYAAGAEWNESRWAHPRFNELLVQARAELDDVKRAEMYREMQQLTSDEGGTIIPMFGQYVSAMNDKVRHADKTAQHWDLDGQKFIERWWVA